MANYCMQFLASKCLDCAVLDNFADNPSSVPVHKTQFLFCRESHVPCLSAIPLRGINHCLQYIPPQGIMQA